MIGQKFIQENLKSAVANKTLARFLIFVGDVGSGRKTLAKEVAKMLGADCIIVDKGVDAVRETVERSYTMSEPVVFVLDGDSMSQPAKSALLKVTEEPPNKVRFILTTTSEENTLDTLVSRACVFRMESYTSEEIAEFAGSDDWRFPNFCSNKYEVDLIKGYGIDEFTDFVKLVADNISKVSGANAFKIENKISFRADDNKYDMKIFLQAFRTECIDRVNQIGDEYPDKMMYLEWISITTWTLDTLRISSGNNQALFDQWIFKIREAGKIAERNE